VTRVRHYFTSESVTAGHPDKMCDQISDAVLDAIYAQDKRARVACETMVTTGMVIVAGEITMDPKVRVDIPTIVRSAIKDIGYVDADMGFDYKSCAVMVALDKQSPDISRGVTEGTGIHKEQGAGDQGLMFGFACRETPELMPMPIMLAHKLAMELARARRSRRLKYLRPDGKSQVTIEYENDTPKRIQAVVLSAQHSPDVKYRTIVKDLIEKVVKKVIPARMLDSKTRYHVNPTGRFVVGGPQGDCGLTGRKIIVDTYGGRGSHGGGCFSGKDPSKVDRSASYMCRHIAKNVVAAGLADRCEIQVSYAIGYAQPLAVLVDTEGTAKIKEEKIAEIIKRVFPLTPKEIIEYLNLRRPIYKKTACYGHFGRPLPEFTWERTNKVKELQRAAKLK